MFGGKIAKKQNKEESIKQLRRELNQAETVVIGAGAGLSTSAGFTYSGPRFDKYFGDFAAKYPFTDMYSGGFYPYDSLEVHWAYWSRYIWINRYTAAPKPVYQELLQLVREKDYFVLTTNVDHQFQKAGFDKRRLFYTQGDYGLFQCSQPCHSSTYDNADAIRQMVEAQGFVIGENGDLVVPAGSAPKMAIPSDLVPRCPVCGKPMSMNLRADDTFVQDMGWEQAAENYAAFLKRSGEKRILFWELGTGMNTPGIIKYSFWKMTAGLPQAKYACVNLDEAFAPEELAEKAICINEDIGAVLAELKS